jgi:hypothetical protein
MKYWEIIADNLSKVGWSWGCVSAVCYKYLYSISPTNREVLP